MKKKNIILIFVLVVLIGVIAFVVVTLKPYSKGPIVVNDKDILLNDYQKDIKITKMGEYTLKGNFNHTVYLETDGDVTLNFANVNINALDGAAIVNMKDYPLIININENSENTLLDAPNNEYDGAIYSEGELIIKGSGYLIMEAQKEGIATKNANITINGGNINILSGDDGINTGGDGGTITINDGDLFIEASGDGIDSNKDMIINGGTLYVMGNPKGGEAALDTNNGYSINGGTVLALGYDMLEKPLDVSKQYTISFNLDNSYKTNDTIKLMRGEEEVLSHVALMPFKTLIISSKDVSVGTYSLLINDQKVSVQGQDTFNISGKTTLVGLPTKNK